MLICLLKKIEILDLLDEFGEKSLSEDRKILFFLWEQLNFDPIS